MHATTLTVQEIIKNKESIYLCAKSFRNDATSLMHQLALKFDFEINDCGAWPMPVYKTKYNDKGILNSEWTFYLHGSHCRFDNLKTGQAVEVRYTEKPEFGFLDGFFFYNYMLTTDRFKNLADWFIEYSNVYTAIDVLAEEGTLTRRTNIRLGNNVLAL